MYVENVNEFSVEPHFNPAHFVNDTIMNENYLLRINNVKSDFLIDKEDEDANNNSDIYLNDRYNCDVFK